MPKKRSGGVGVDHLKSEASNGALPNGYILSQGLRAFNWVVPIPPKPSFWLELPQIGYSLTERRFRARKCATRPILSKVGAISGLLGNGFGPQGFRSLEKRQRLFQRFPNHLTDPPV